MLRWFRAHEPRCVVAIIALIGVTPIAVAQLPVGDPQPAGEPAKARIAFVADRGIRTIVADGSDLKRVTTRDDAPGDEDPAWSPDGATIAFVRWGGDDEDEGPLVWLMAADGTGQRQLTADPPRGYSESSPTWSPDGRRIAFVRTRLGRARTVSSIVAQGVDGADRRTLHSVTNDVDDDAPLVFLDDLAWAPNGNRIAFTRSTLAGAADPDVTAPTVFTVGTDGGGPRRLLAPAEDPAWSPNGDRIAYASFRGRCRELCSETTDLYVVNADGANRRRLLATRAREGAPSWSADGGRIAFHSDRNSTQAEDEPSPPEIYSIKPDGTCLTWLTNGTAYSESPAWQPGGGRPSEPGGCGPTAREPLIETDSSRFERARAFPVWWFGRVAPNGLLLTHVGADDHSVWFGYHDCGRFDPNDCGAFLNVENLDLCVGARYMKGLGPLTIVRGALLHRTGDDEISASDLFTGRTRVRLDTASGHAPPAGVVDWLRRVQEASPPDRLPDTRMPRGFWRELTSVAAAYRRLGSARAVAGRLGLRPREVSRRLALGRRLAKLGVKRRLAC